MECTNLSQTIRKIRETVGEPTTRAEMAFPYLELYWRKKNREKAWDVSRLDPKQELMGKIRTRFQALSNPHQHDVTLKMTEAGSVLPKLKQHLEMRAGGERKIMLAPFKAKGKSYSVTPKKRHLLYYRLR
jgi:hypothetical protein